MADGEAGSVLLENKKKENKKKAEKINISN